MLDALVRPCANGLWIFSRIVIVMSLNRLQYLVLPLASDPSRNVWSAGLERQDLRQFGGLGQ